MVIKYVELLNGRVRAIGESLFLPELVGELQAVDITDYQGEVEEGYIYDSENNLFIAAEMPEIIEHEPIEPQPTLEEMAQENLLETKYQTLLLEMML